MIIYLTLMPKAVIYPVLVTGTVAASIADIDFVKRREDIEGVFEDGTVSFLSIASIRHGFKTLRSLTISAISRYAEKNMCIYIKLLLLNSWLHKYDIISW